MMSRKSKPLSSLRGGRRRRWAAVAVCLSTLWVLPAAAEPLPQVETRASIESTLFRTGLGEELSDVEQTAAAVLAGKAKEFFPYLQWRADSPQPAARLTLKMIQKPIPIGEEVGFRIYLEYEAELLSGGSAVKLPEPIPPPEYTARSPGDCEARPEIYRSWEFDFPSQDAAKVKFDLECHLDRHFSDQDFRLRLQSTFLTQIALVEDLIVDEQRRRVVLPVAWDDLKASDKSVLRVEFESGPQGEQAQSGKMELKPGLKASSDEWQNYVQCLVKLLWFRDIFVDSVRPWDPNLPDVLGPQKRRRLQVFMEEYFKEIGLRTPTEPF